MEFDIEKCTMLVMKSRKGLVTEGIELPNEEKFGTLYQRETYNYLGILEGDTIK